MFKSKKTEMVKDPVCGMRVSVDKTSPNAVHEGQTYYFCSLSCRDQFVANTKAYA